MNLKEKTIKQLEAELKGLKILNVALIVVMGLLFIICIHGLLTKDNNRVFGSIIIIPLASSAIIPINYGNIKKIKAELESRNSSI